LRPPTEEEITESRDKSIKDPAAAAEERKDKAAVEYAVARLRQALQDQPDLAELSKHVLVDETPEGTRIQLVDQDGRSMFEPGKAEPTPRVELLLKEVAKVINGLPNRISVSGHTDGASFSGPGGYSNWDLSAARANAS